MNKYLSLLEIAKERPVFHAAHNCAASGEQQV